MGAPSQLPNVTLYVGLGKVLAGSSLVHRIRTCRSHQAMGSFPALLSLRRPGVVGWWAIGGVRRGMWRGYGLVRKAMTLIGWEGAP